MFDCTYPPPACEKSLYVNENKESRLQKWQRVRMASRTLEYPRMVVRTENLWSNEWYWSELRERAEEDAAGLLRWSWNIILVRYSDC
jgi:hypothetical protein